MGNWTPSEAPGIARRHCPNADLGSQADSPEQATVLNLGGLGPIFRRLALPTDKRLAGHMGVGGWRQCSFPFTSTGSLISEPRSPVTWDRPGTLSWCKREAQEPGWEGVGCHNFRTAVCFWPLGPGSLCDRGSPSGVRLTSKI